MILPWSLLARRQSERDTPDQQPSPAALILIEYRRESRDSGEDFHQAASFPIAVLQKVGGWHLGADYPAGVISTGYDKWEHMFATRFLRFLANPPTCYSLSNCARVTFHILHSHQAPNRIVIPSMGADLEIRPKTRDAVSACTKL
jgi:hypothetical protein